MIEKGWLGGGNTGRNTTIIRANYGIPEAIRFYQHSLELYQGLEAETGAEILAGEWQEVGCGAQPWEYRYRKAA